MSINDFYRRLKQHCEKTEKNCVGCRFRDFCYMPPSEITDDMVQRVAMDLLNGEI